MSYFPESKPIFLNFKFSIPENKTFRTQEIRQMCVQLSSILQSTQASGREISDVKETIAHIRKLLSPLSRANGIDTLRGYEGSIGAIYFKAFPHLVTEGADKEMKLKGRNRRPPKDRCSALLSHGYALLLKDVTTAIFKGWT